MVNNVPWPARPLPRVGEFDTAPGSPASPYAPRVAAVLFTNVYGQLEDREFPVGIRIGEMDPRLNAQPNIGTNRTIVYFGGGTTAPRDPNAMVYRRFSRDPARAGETLLPIVVYRQQVTNAAYPRVSGDLVQVTPKLERIPWTSCPSILCDTEIHDIPDRLIGLREEVDPTSVRSVLYLRDQQPVLRGARYRYLVVRFEPNGEVQEIISAGEVEIKYAQGAPCIDC